MNNLILTLEDLKKRKKMGLMTHVVVGYPSLQKTIKIVKVMADNGADLIELQIPFSDPLADGPTIMKACEQSLEKGTKVKNAFEVAKILSSQISQPLLFMAYYNTVFRYGIEKFLKDAKSCGISGLIVPDISIDEEAEEHFLSLCKKYSLSNIQVISPASTDERLQKNAKVASGFVYCTAHQGITGAKNQLDPSINSYLIKVRNKFSVPLAVGFGISKKEHLQQIKPYADIAVVGSAIINVINQSTSKNLEKNIGSFINELKI